jgi:hypothetical protein
LHDDCKAFGPGSIFFIIKNHKNSLDQRTRLKRIRLA